MNTKTPNNSERVWVKNKVVHCGDEEYPISELKAWLEEKLAY